MYLLRWKNPLIDANKAAPIEVPVGSVVSNKASISFTGKGAANYGKIQQENQMRLLENFADSVAPLYPTVGQEWFDTTTGVLKVCAAVTTEAVTWRSLGGVQATNQDAGPPSPASVGDLWSEAQSSSNTNNPFPSATGTMYVYNGFGRHPQNGNNIGGWNQLWPQIDTVAGREEYDHVATLLNQLAGPISGGGNGMIGKSTPELSNLTALDTSLRVKYSVTPTSDPATHDISILTPVDAPTDELMVDVTSQDWDTLLAVARKTISRLELPPEMITDISSMPFVSDGRPVPTWLRRLEPSNIMYPTLERRSNRRFGIATLSRAFTETVNVLNNAMANRYSLKGISGATGPNEGNFNADTLIVPHHIFQGPAVGNTDGFLTLRFNFTTEADMNSFLNSGGALQLIASHQINTSTQTSGDVDFKALLDNRGVVRMTKDKTRILYNGAQPAMSVPPSAIGLQDVLAADVGTPVVLTTQILSSANYKITVTRMTATQLNVLLEFVSSGPMNGVVNLAWSIIRDGSVYMNGGVATSVFGSPLAYADLDKLSSSSFLN